MYYSGWKKYKDVGENNNHPNITILGGFTEVLNLNLMRLWDPVRFKRSPVASSKYLLY